MCSDLQSSSLITPLSSLTFFSWRTVQKPKFSVADPDPSGSELVCRIQINHIFTWIRILRSRQDPDASLQNLGASFGFELFGSANIAVNCLFSLLFDGCKWVPSFSWGIDGRLIPVLNPAISSGITREASVFDPEISSSSYHPHLHFVNRISFWLFLLTNYAGRLNLLGQRNIIICCAQCSIEALL